MKARRYVLSFPFCVALMLVCIVSSVHAAANLVVISVSGPTQAFLNQTVSVTYQVKNMGDAPSEGYEVELYLSRDKAINPTADLLLKKVSFANGLTAGLGRKTTTKIIIPNYHVDGLSGGYYYGAIIKSNVKASTKQVAIVRYQSNGDGTVTDSKTALMWQKTDDGKRKNWSDAHAYCESLALGGHDDWVLPSLEALATIVDYSKLTPAIDPAFDCRSDYYWSSSTIADFAGNAWLVLFHYGNTGWDSKLSPNYVRCVRGGP